MKECTCEPDHSVTKLGHCRDCPHYRPDQPHQIDRSLHGCVNQDHHSDGTKHDFLWATYEDETMSNGVCRCGLMEIDYSMARMP